MRGLASRLGGPSRLQGGDLRRRGTVWALDVETTSLDLATAAVVAIGMVPVVDGIVRLGQAYRSPVRPGRGADPDTGEGIVAHHLRPCDVARGPRIAGVIRAVRRRLVGADAVLVHHAPVDVGVLSRLAGPDGWPATPVLDTVRQIERLNRRRRVAGGAALPTSLSEARAAVGLPAFSAHDPLDDAIATAELWLALPL